MSDFCGIVPEIPGLSIDRFDENNSNSSVFLLSHCHFDHLKGIDDGFFLDNLFRREDVFIYMSLVSVKILSSLKPNLKEKLRHLSINTPTLITIPSGKNEKNSFMNVTLLPAGHCPGSVMFLIETDKTILYTGDYRINSDDLKKFTAFYLGGNTENKTKTIDKVYLDTTFFHPDYLKFPSRDESVEHMYNLINESLATDRKNHILLQTSAHIGYEDLYIQLYKKFKIPIHVNKTAFEFYKHFPEMDRAITLDENTQIHACHDWNSKLEKQICKTIFSNLKFNSLIIKLSALRWKKEECFTPRMSKERDNFDVHYLCYATHASYEEIKEFMIFLKPKEIEACVYQNNSENNNTMIRLLNELVESFKIEHKKLQIRKLIVLRNKKTSPKVEREANFNETHCDLTTLLETAPPFKRFK